MANQKINFTEIEGFDWDEGNIDKNWKKHKVHYKEAEEVFFDKNLLVNKDIEHSKTEQRYQCLGKTNTNRLLFISFTFRRNKIRVISARPASQKERRKYEKKPKKNTTI